MKSNLPHCMVALMLLLAGRLGADENRGIKIVEVRKIWDAAPHNAFTNLERFKGGWYCAFREGRGHAGGGDYGKISRDRLQRWQGMEISGTDAESGG